MFKVLVLQAPYSPSHKACEFEIRDRLSFQCFLALGSTARCRMRPRSGCSASALGNTRRSAIRSAVEHVCAGQKHRMGLFIRTIGIARARIKIGIANLAYNFQLDSAREASCARMTRPCPRNRPASQQTPHQPFEQPHAPAPIPRRNAFMCQNGQFFEVSSWPGSHVSCWPRRKPIGRTNWRPDRTQITRISRAVDDE